LEAENYHQNRTAGANFEVVSGHRGRARRKHFGSHFRQCNSLAAEHGDHVFALQIGEGVFFTDVDRLDMMGATWRKARQLAFFRCF
jgi:hypothetical protein